MITLLRWRKTNNNGRNKDAVVKVCNCEAFIAVCALATPVGLTLHLFVL
jgi:hypothetical protein